MITAVRLYAACVFLAILVALYLLAYLPAIVVWLFPALHPCRRGNHLPDFRHRVRIQATGKGRRSRAGWVEQANYCPRCGKLYSEWRTVDGPHDMHDTDLTAEENERLIAGGTVYLFPNGGKLWE